MSTPPTDIVQWLRGCRCFACRDEHSLNHQVVADEIEQLQAALQEIAHKESSEYYEVETHIGSIARRALEAKE